MSNERTASVIRLSDGHTVHVKESVQELRDRIDAARRNGPLGIIAVSEDIPNGVIILLGHVISVSPR